MLHPELFPSESELPALQKALDASELTENELLLLMSAGPRLSESSDPLADLHDAVAGDVLLDEDDASLDASPLMSLLKKIDEADDLQRRAPVIVALQDSWVSQGVTLPSPGLNAQK